MTERQQLHRRYRRVAHSGSRAGSGAVRHGETVPSAVVPPPSTPPDDLTLFGFPAEPADGPVLDEPASVSTETVPGPETWLVLRRPDASAGSMLLIGGTAGGMSLFLPWVQHGEVLGLSLVTAAAGLAGTADLVRSGLLLPVAVALGGGVLFLLGLLAFRPARTHRATGVAALFVSLAVAAGVVVRVADAESTAVLTDPGVLCAIVVAGFGLLGALKAMLTTPRFTDAD